MEINRSHCETYEMDARHCSSPKGAATALEGSRGCMGEASDWLGLGLGDSRSLTQGKRGGEPADPSGTVEGAGEEECTYVASVSSHEASVEKGKEKDKRSSRGGEEEEDGNDVGNVSPKRRRVATAHNLSERRRRNKFNQKIQTLQRLVPNSNKTDKASILDEAIDHLRRLQSHIKMTGSASITPFQMTIPHHLQLPMMAPISQLTSSTCHSQPSPLHYSTFLPFPGSCAIIADPSPVLMACQPQGAMNMNVFNRINPWQRLSAPCFDSVLISGYPFASDETSERRSCGSPASKGR